MCRSVQYSTIKYSTIMEDYVQFGRDILFITSHRSAKVTTRQLKLHRGCSQMTSAFFGVSDTLTPLGAYVSLSSAFGMPLGASN